MRSRAIRSLTVTFRRPVHGPSAHRTPGIAASTGPSCGRTSRRRYVYALVSSETPIRGCEGRPTRRISSVLRFARRNTRGACHHAESICVQSPDPDWPSMRSCRSASGLTARSRWATRSLFRPRRRDQSCPSGQSTRYLHPSGSALRYGEDPLKSSAFLLFSVQLREGARSSVIVPEAVGFELETPRALVYLSQRARALRLSLDGGPRNAVNYTLLHPHRFHGSARRAPAGYRLQPSFISRLEPA